MIKQQDLEGLDCLCGNPVAIFSRWRNHDQVYTPQLSNTLFVNSIYSPLCFGGAVYLVRNLTTVFFSVCIASHFKLFTLAPNPSSYRQQMPKQSTWAET